MNELALVRAAPGAALLLASFVAVSLAGLYAAPSIIERNLLRPCGLVSRRDQATLLTSAFVHADQAHLLLNAYTFWAFAFPLERAIGTSRLLALFFTGVLAGSLGSCLRHGRDPGYRTLGASGAILAVLFAAIVHTSTASIFVLPVPIPFPAPVFAGVYLACSLYAARRGGGRVNHEAHLSGALAGIAFVAVTDPAAVARAVHAIIG